LTDKPWGTVSEDGTFTIVPKGPMIAGGYGPPPFDIEVWPGYVKHIVEEPGDVCVSGSEELLLQKEETQAG
jgi:hypothetical protein